MNDADVEKSSYSGFERFLFFVTPIIFTVVLLIVLLALFNYPVRNSLLEMAQSIPIVKNWVPEPTSSNGSTKGNDGSAKKNANQEKKINELNDLLASKDAELKKATAMIEQKDAEISTLKQNVQQSEQKLVDKGQTDEQYQAQITSLANMYAQMQPSKSAPIIENLTLEEQVLVLNAMKPSDRVKILEKMTPKVAADATIRLKDVQSSENLAIAALQSRIAKVDANAKKDSTSLDNQQLSQTFMTMTPKNAAKIVLDTTKISEDKALRILRSVDDATRSQILAAMQDTDANAKVAAKLLSKIMPAK
ncbi:MotE family protein [Paenibacillus selenitireducens]|uniref:primosomal protein n=1 Tax=Paenibacillus selenitireducens TaxID=1324314 RepID=UPI001E29FC91|nr:primosomal protein [Paenibacillus selenitireducens]